jgi:hypothetical protein
MRSVHVGLPGLVALVLLASGFQQVVGGVGEPGGSAPAMVRGGLVPISIGVVLLLVALAVGRRSRAGYLLGLWTAILLVLAGIGVVVIEIPYLDRGGLGAALGAGLVVVALLWLVAWAGYGLSMWRARSSFAATWQPGDRRIAIAMAGIVLAAPAAYVALGAVEGQAQDALAADQARAEALVAGTALAVTVVDVTLEPAVAGGSQAAVEHLTVDLELRSTEGYSLAAAPTLCLADLLTAQDPGYKPDTFCWGSPGPAVSLDAALADLAVPTGARTIRVELARGASRCAFPPGRWRADLTLAPRVGTAAGGEAPGTFAISAEVKIPTDVAPPSAAEGQASACIASTISP